MVNNGVNFNKFEFNTETEQCWQYIGATKILIEDDMKMEGMYNYQKVFQLDRTNKGYWINYTITFSGNKLWFKSWFKKMVVDKNEPDGIRWVHYSKRQEKDKDNPIVIIQFDYSDEMIKVFDEVKQKSKYVNRLQ